MWHILETGEMHLLFYRKTDRKRPLGRPKHRREYNNKICLPEFG
jgi:hypothetical protein